MALTFLEEEPVVGAGLTFLDDEEVATPPEQPEATLSGASEDTLGDDFSGLGANMEIAANRLGNTLDFSALQMEASLADRLRNQTEVRDTYKAKIASGEPVGHGYGESEREILRLTDELARIRDPKVRAETLGRIGERQTTIEEAQKRLSPEMKQWQSAKGMDAASVFAKNPIEVAANIMLPSLVTSAPALAGSIVGSALGPAGTAAGAGAGSAAVEYSNGILDSLQEAGVNFRDPASIEAALANPEVMAKARDFAVKRSIPVAAFDAASAGLAGRILGPALGSGVKKVVAATAKEMGLQAAMGATGEGSAQVVSGQPLDGKAMFEEAVGELVSAEPVLNARSEIIKAKAANLEFVGAPATAAALREIELPAQPIPVNPPAVVETPQATTPVVESETPAPFTQAAPVGPVDIGPQTDAVYGRETDIYDAFANVPKANPNETQPINGATGAGVSGSEIEEPGSGSRTDAPSGEGVRATPADAVEAEGPKPKPVTGTKAVAMQHALPFGPGKMTEGEITPTATSTKNAVMEAEREARNADPIVREARKSNETTFAEADARFAENPNVGQDTVAALRSGAKTEVNEVDEAVLLYEKVRLRNIRDNELPRATDEYLSVEEREAAKKRWEAAEQQINELDEATRRSGSIWGRLGQFRQRLLRDDWTFEPMERRARVAKGGSLTPDESAKIKAEADRIAALETELGDIQVALEQKRREEAADAATAEMVKAAQDAKAEDPEVKTLAQRIIGKLTSAADAARKRIRERLGKLSAGIDPTVLYDLSIIGAEKIAKGAVNFGRWSSEMLSDLGNSITEYLEPAWKASNELLDATVEANTPKQKREKVTRAVRKADPKAQQDNILERIQKRVEDGDELGSLRPFVQKLALSLVRSGINQREPLVDAVHAELTDIIPSLERNQTMDLISGYGDFAPLDKEAAKTTLRELKGEMQQVAKIADMQAKRAPKKTGVERRTPSAEERRLIKEVNELKRKGGFVVTDPAAQLKSALGAIQTRLRNEIADLDLAIAEKRPLPSKETSVQYDAETTALKAQRDAKKAEYDALFPKAPMTDAKKIELAGKALDRSIATLEADLKAGKIYADPKKPKLVSAELDAKRARLEALKAERENLQNLDTARVEAEKEASLLEAIKRASTAIPEPAQGAPTADTQRVAELKAKLEAVRAARADSPEARQKKIDAAIAATKESIADYDRRLREGDFSTKAKASGPTNTALEALRAERDAMEALFRELRAATMPKKSRDEIILQAYKTRTLNRIAEMQERIAKNDFAPKPKKPVRLDADAKRIQFELQRVKKDFLEARMKDARAKRPLPKKIFETARDTINTARAVMTSFDVSAVLRQGGFVAFGNPARALRAIPDMFRALASEKKRFEINQEILSRPNAELYRQSKLYISDPNEVSLSKMEEAYMSRFASKIPGVGASERAYTTFLNVLRADTFDAMTKTLSKSGAPTPEEAAAIANYINVATGRGNLAGASGAAISLNAAFFSPRYLISRFELLAAQPLYGGTMRTRKLVAKEYAKFFIGAGVVYALGMAAGGDFEDDPRSSDFGKIRFGDTRLDPLSGMLQVTVLASRLISGEKKTIKGDVLPIRVKEGEKLPFGSEDAFGLTGRFLRTKLSPPVGAFFDLASGRNVIGEPVTPAETAKRMVIPLSFGDILEAMQAQGVPRGTALSILALFGMGLQTFEERE